MSKSGDDGRFNEVSFSFDDLSAEFDFPAQSLNFFQSFDVTLNLQVLYKDGISIDIFYRKC
jgi:hypothetical protein